MSTKGHDANFYLQEIDTTLKKNNQERNQIIQEISKNKLQFQQNQESSDMQISVVHQSHKELKGFCDSFNNEVNKLENLVFFK